MVISGSWHGYGLVGVIKTLGRPHLELALDDARVRSSLSRGVQPSDEGEYRMEPDGFGVVRVQRGGKCPMP